MNFRDEMGYWFHRDEILRRLEEWGYDPHAMSVKNADETGYDQFTRRGKFIEVNEDRTAPIISRETWKDPAHWQWIVRTVQEIEGGE